MLISKTSIENLKNQIDIVDIVSSYIELKKSGANFKACCPFHSEDTASFTVCTRAFHLATLRINT